MNAQNNRGKDWLIKIGRIYLGLGLLLGIVSLAMLLSIPSEASGRMILGLTPTRLVIVIFQCGILILFGWLLWWSSQKKAWFETWIEKLDGWLEQTSTWGIALAISVVGFFLGAYALLLTPEINEPFTRAYFERLAPLIFWFTAWCLQTMVVLLILRARRAPDQSRAKAKLILSFALIIGVFLGLWSWLVKTQFESESRVLGWNETGTPLLETQVLLAWVIGMLVVGLVALLPVSADLQAKSRFSRYGIDIILAIGIWLSAVLLWNSIPLTPTWFLSNPAPPNFEFYPNSDALIYDMSAQQLLVGEGFQFQGVPYARRPIHTLYLTGLHALAGQDYEQVVTIQVAVLSLLPVVIYLLTKAVDRRLSGILAAVLILLREANAIAMAGVITTSHAKLLMVDLPATLCLVCFILAMVVWLKGNGGKQEWVVVSGGILGICMLIRVEFAAMILASLLVMLIYFWKRPRELITNAALFGLGIALLLSPWIWRNYDKTGELFLDSPSFRAEDILTNIKQEPLEIEPSEEGEIPGFSSTPVSPGAPPQPAPSNQLVNYFLGNSSRVARYTLSHAIHSQLQVLLVLPTTIRPLDSLVGFIGHGDLQKLWEECCSSGQYPRRLPYWFQWNGIFPQQALIPLFINMAVILFGIYIAWRNYRLTGLLPLIFSLTHLLANAAIRKSGGRYILPADWVGVMYFSIGLAALTFRFLSLFWKQKLVEHPLLTIHVEQTKPRDGRSFWRQPGFYAAAMGIFLVGWSLPIVERSIQPQFTEQRKMEMLETLLDSNSLDDMDRRFIEQSISEQKLVVEAGRALFPRFYRSDTGEPGTNNPMGPLPYARLGFYLVGPNNKAIIFPAVKKPAFFPNGSDVIVISSLDGEVLAVGIFESPRKISTLLADFPDFESNPN